MAAADAGVQIACPQCGTTGLQKAMIPVLADGGGVSYLCQSCARQLIDVTQTARHDND